MENRPWGACPNNIDRITGQTVKDRDASGGTPGPDPVNVTLTSPTGATRTVTMYKPLTANGQVADALILRRYKPPVKADQSDAWTVPDDRKVNPWDLNEPDPTDNGTMGTIPGPVIECAVGDSVVVHFRNLDQRTDVVTTTQEVCFPLPFGGQICVPFPVTTTQPITIEKRVHSLHPHGIVFEAPFDGAYPLSPPDPGQPIPASEAAAWASVPGFSGTLKKGDRVPPGGSFIYRWNTFGWPSTAGVWLYHDHSICDMENVGLGAIGILVIHNPADTQNEVDIRLATDPTELDPAFLPGGDPNGSPVFWRCFPFPFADVRALPSDLENLAGTLMTGAGGGMGDGMGTAKMAAKGRVADKADNRAKARRAAPETDDEAPVLARTFRRGNVMVELDPKLELIRRICLPHYRTPPAKALYLQLFHTLNGVSGMCVNGRTYLGNTPTMLAGPNTRMRFGVVGMGSDIHTFHIHGHRWIIPGPHGNTPAAIQGSVLDTPVYQFEDTRVFGPANSFVFTIQGQPGSFMRAGGPGEQEAIGEWHMHCHVLAHMMSGMMGSLLIVNGGELAFGLPVGVPCPEDMTGSGGMGGGMGGGKTVTVHVKDFQFDPDPVNIKAGDTVLWVWDNDDHSSTSDTGIWDSGVHNTGFTFDHTFPAAGSFPYHCSIHGGPGTGMHGTVVVSP